MSLLHKYKLLSDFVTRIFVNFIVLHLTFNQKIFVGANNLIRQLSHFDKDSYLPYINSYLHYRCEILIVGSLSYTMICTSNVLLTLRATNV